MCVCVVCVFGVLQSKSPNQYAAQAPQAGAQAGGSHMGPCPHVKAGAFPRMQCCVLGPVSFIWLGDVAHQPPQASGSFLFVALARIWFLVFQHLAPAFTSTPPSTTNRQEMFNRLLNSCKPEHELQNVQPQIKGISKAIDTFHKDLLATVRYVHGVRVVCVVCVRRTYAKWRERNLLQRCPRTLTPFAHINTTTPARLGDGRCTRSPRSRTTS